MLELRTSVSGGEPRIYPRTLPEYFFSLVPASINSILLKRTGNRRLCCENKCKIKQSWLHLLFTVPWIKFGTIIFIFRRNKSLKSPKLYRKAQNHIESKNEQCLVNSLLLSWLKYIQEDRNGNPHLWADPRKLRVNTRSLLPWRHKQVRSEVFASGRFLWNWSPNRKLYRLFVFFVGKNNTKWFHRPNLSWNTTTQCQSLRAQTENHERWEVHQSWINVTWLK